MFGYKQRLNHIDNEISKIYYNVCLMHEKIDDIKEQVCHPAWKTLMNIDERLDKFDENFKRFVTMFNEFKEVVAKVRGECVNDKKQFEAALDIMNSIAQTIKKDKEITGDICKYAHKLHDQQFTIDAIYKAVSKEEEEPIKKPRKTKPKESKPKEA